MTSSSKSVFDTLPAALKTDRKRDADLIQP
jgi:hypothetical protein